MYSKKMWLVVAGILAFWFILFALFGVKSVRNGLRVFVFLMLLLGIAIVIGEKIIVTFRTKYPPERPKTAYHAITARSRDGQTTSGCYVIGLLREGTKEYTPQLDFGLFADYNDAQNKADELNARTGLTKGQINRLINRWC